MIAVLRYLGSRYFRPGTNVPGPPSTSVLVPMGHVRSQYFGTGPPSTSVLVQKVLKYFRPGTFGPPGSSAGFPQLAPGPPEFSRWMETSRDMVMSTIVYVQVYFRAYQA